MTSRQSKKPAWVVGKERAAKADREVWLFGIHAVRAALLNPRRRLRRLIVTRNGADRLEEAIARAGIEPEIADARRFSAPLDPGSLHQGAALQSEVLDWGDLDAIANTSGAETPPLILALDRVTDPHNVGAILRSAEVFGARAVIAPRRHAAPETGALAKASSGALERQPYVRIANLGNGLIALSDLGYSVIGLDGDADQMLETAFEAVRDRPLVVVLGAEGAGLRPRTRELCEALARIGAASDFASLNVSNAAAIALYAAGRR